MGFDLDLFLEKLKEGGYLKYEHELEPVKDGMNPHVLNALIRLHDDVKFLKGQWLKTSEMLDKAVNKAQ